MKKDLIKKISARKPRLGTVVLSITAVLVLAAGIFYGQFKSVSADMSALSTRLTGWMHDRNDRLQKNLVKVKKLAVNKEAAQEIHFEFYTVLPNMKAAPLAEKQVQVAASNDNERSRHAAAVSARAAPGAGPSAPATAIFDAGKLQTALKEEMGASNEVDASQQYVLQMGVFRSLASAENFCQTFLMTGFSARVVASDTTKGKIYSVQVGPFNTKGQAVLAQRQLRKNNLKGIIRKL